MGSLSQFDMFIFFGSLLAVMAIGIWVGRKEDTSEEFYLAGKSARWWGVAGSIFGSNISANHMVGMMGVGFTLGFVESQFEISAIAGLMLLCYGFLPVYRRLNVFTLSEYLSRRYNEPSRVIYAAIMIITIVVIQMVPGFYIGSRSLNILLLEDQAIEQAVNPQAAPIVVDQTDEAADADVRKVRIDFHKYVIGILIMAIVTGAYTIVGGLKAVIITDVIQSVMMIVAAVVVAYFAFASPEIGGWGGMRALDAAQGEASKMHLYLPSDHPERPWTGMLTGLMILHFNYWGTNQFIVQRALAARSDTEARIGIITAGFFKLIVPFVSIGTGVAAYYLFKAKMPAATLDGDTAFPMLMREVVRPIGFGVAGIVAAGLIGAILSSIDSMLNSGATIITFDVYKRYIKPQASERELVLVGRICIAVFVVAAALLAILIMDPNRKEHFFTYVSGHQSRLVAGVVVAFALGMFWKRATPAGGLAAIIAGIVFSYGSTWVYNEHLGSIESVAAIFGKQLNFFHGAAFAALGSALVHVIVSLMTQPDSEKSKMTWTELGGHDPRAIKRVVAALGLSLAVYAILAMLMVYANLRPVFAGVAGAAWTLAMFIRAARTAIAQRQPVAGANPVTAMLREDRFWAGLLSATAIFMMFYYR